MQEIKAQEIAKNIFYLTNVFTEHREIVRVLEDSNTSDSFSKIVPRRWEEWFHGNPEKVENKDGSTEILSFEFRTDDEARAGWQKFIDWDFSLPTNHEWPREQLNETYSDAHSEASKFINLIDIPYKKSLKVWSELSGVPEPKNWISRNYTVKKYKVGGGVGEHADRNVENDADTMDWTALIYLTDDYAGGEVVFGNLNLKITPEAGSILIFPCDEVHMAKPVTSGTKIFIFMYIHSVYGVSESIKEHPSAIVKTISKKGN